MKWKIEHEVHTVFCGSACARGRATVCSTHSQVEDWEAAVISVIDYEQDRPYARSMPQISSCDVVGVVGFHPWNNTCLVAAVWHVSALTLGEHWSVSSIDRKARESHHRSLAPNGLRTPQLAWCLAEGLRCGSPIRPLLLFGEPSSIQATEGFGFDRQPTIERSCMCRELYRNVLFIFPHIPIFCHGLHTEVGRTQ